MFWFVDDGGGTLVPHSRVVGGGRWGSAESEPHQGLQPVLHRPDLVEPKSGERPQKELERRLGGMLLRAEEDCLRRYRKY